MRSASERSRASTCVKSLICFTSNFTSPPSQNSLKSTERFYNTWDCARNFLTSVLSSIRRSCSTFYSVSKRAIISSSLSRAYRISCRRERTYNVYRCSSIPSYSISGRYNNCNLIPSRNPKRSCKTMF